MATEIENLTREIKQLQNFANVIRETTIEMKKILLDIHNVMIRIEHNQQEV